MNHLAVLPGAALLALALTACPSRKADPAQAPPPAPPAATPAAEVASSPGASYATYRGQLAGRPDSLTLHLTIAPARAGSELGGGDLYGACYGADGQVRRLYRQRPSPPDSLLLSEYDPARRDADGNEQEIRWTLRREPGGSLSGTRAGQVLRLRPAAGGLRLAVRTFADSVAAYPGRANSPYGQLSLQVLLPADGGPGGAMSQLTTSLLREQTGDSAARPLAAADLAGFWKKHRAGFTKEYREAVADMAPDPADSTDAPSYMLRFDEQQKGYVLCQQGSLLSLAVLSYSYTGGAHGSYGTSVRSFDLRSGRALTFDAIFRPEARTRLLPLLERGVRRTLGLAPHERLDTELFENKIELTTNVCLTPGGALFVFQPYEIASYAQGEIEVFVPLAELRPLLREGLPLPGAEAL